MHQSQSQSQDRALELRSPEDLWQSDLHKGQFHNFDVLKLYESEGPKWVLNYIDDFSLLKGTRSLELHGVDLTKYHPSDLCLLFGQFSGSLTSLSVNANSYATPHDLFSLIFLFPRLDDLTLDNVGIREEEWEGKDNFSRPGQNPRGKLTLLNTIFKDSNSFISALGRMQLSFKHVHIENCSFWKPDDLTGPLSGFGHHVEIFEASRNRHQRENGDVVDWYIDLRPFNNLKRVRIGLVDFTMRNSGVEECIQSISSKCIEKIEFDTSRSYSAGDIHSLVDTGGNPNLLLAWKEMDSLMQQKLSDSPEVEEPREQKAVVFKALRDGSDLDRFNFGQYFLRECWNEGIKIEFRRYEGIELDPVSSVDATSQSFDELCSVRKT